MKILVLIIDGYTVMRSKPMSEPMANELMEAMLGSFVSGGRLSVAMEDDDGNG